MVKDCNKCFKLKGLFNRVQQNVLLSSLSEINLYSQLELKCIWRGTAEHLNLKNLESLGVFGRMKLMTLLTATFFLELIQFEIY